MENDRRSKKELARIRATSAFRRLAHFFARGGCVREPRPARFGEGSQRYKKGWEVRILVDNHGDLVEVRLLLTAIGLTPARPYRKYGERFVQPVYGLTAAELFAKL